MGQEWQLGLADSLRRIAQRFANVLGLEVRELCDIWSDVRPSAAMVTTVATGIRRSRMHRTPPHPRGSPRCA